MNITRILRMACNCAIAIAATGIIASCSSSKSTSQRDIPGEVPAEISLQTPSQRYQELCKTYGDWQDVTLPVRVSLEAPKSMSVSARASMKRDQWISISVRMLGFEVASMYVDRDSVHVVSRYHKAYVSESLQRIFGNNDVSVGDIQDLLLGRGFIIGPAGTTFTPALSTAVELSPSDEGLMILPAAQPQGFEYGFILAQDANRVAAASVSVRQTHSGTIIYNSPVETRQAGNFAGQAAIQVTAGKTIAASLQWNFPSAKWNTGETRSWSRPSGYTRMDASALIAKLSKL